MSDRKVQLSVSKDGGHNYGAQREKSLGEQGQYATRVRFNRFGQSPQFVIKIRCTSPINCDLMGAVADVEVSE